jgi:hypothetical protein
MRFASVAARPRRSRHVAVAGVLLLAAACGDDTGSTPTPPPAPVASVQIAPSTITIGPTDLHQLDVAVRAANGTLLHGRQITWRSSNEAVARVSPTGIVSAQGEGTATVTASSGGRQGQAEIRVRAPSPVPVLSSISPATIQAETLGSTLTLRGSGFTRNMWVRINQTPRIPTFVSETELRVYLESNLIGTPGTLTVTVLNLPPGGGLSEALSLVVTPHPDARPVPVLLSLAPVSAVAGSGEQTVTLHGSGFVPQSLGVVSGQERPTVFVDQNTLRMRLSAEDVARTRQLWVNVWTRGPGGGSSGFQTLRVVPDSGS